MTLTINDDLINFQKVGIIIYDFMQVTSNWLLFYGLTHQGESIHYVTCFVGHTRSAFWVFTKSM